MSIEDAVREVVERYDEIKINGVTLKRHGDGWLVQQSYGSCDETDDLNDAVEMFVRSVGDGTASGG